MNFARLGSNLVWNSIWIGFKSRADAWCVLIGSYRFGRIVNVERRMKRWLDAPDRPVPIRLSDLFLATWSGSKGRGEMGGCSPGWPRVPVAGGEERLRKWTSSSFWRFPNHGECTTGFGAMRRSRWRGWRGQLRPVMGESLGWRHTGGRSFGWKLPVTILCEIRQEEGINLCARNRET
jgi:hypothetical protein